MIREKKIEFTVNRVIKTGEKSRRKKGREIHKSTAGKDTRNERDEEVF